MSANTIWIGDIDPWMDENYVKSIFNNIAPVKNIKVMKKNGQSIGYGFIEFDSEEIASEILQKYNGKSILGYNRLLKLSRAQYNLSKRGEEEHQVYVCDMDLSIGEDQLKDIFLKEFQSVISAKIICDPMTRVSKGYGFVKFRDIEDANKAVVEMNGRIINNKRIRVNKASYKENKEKIGGVSYMNNPYMDMNNIPMNHYMQYPMNPMSQMDIMNQSFNTRQPPMFNGDYNQMYHQPIVQNNYINNFSFYPSSMDNITSKDPSNNDISEKLKKSLNNLEKRQGNNQNKYGESQVLNNLNTKASPYIPPYSNLMYSNNHDNDRKDNDEINKLQGKQNTTDYNSSLFGGFASLINSNDRASFLSSLDNKKKISTDDWTSSMQKRLERMSINDSYTGDLMKNEFVDYVYNYRFSINDRDDLNILNSEVSAKHSRPENINYLNSPSIIGIKPEPIELGKVKDIRLAELKEDEENEVSLSDDDQSVDKEERNENQVNYNNYYNSLFANKK